MSDKARIRRGAAPPKGKRPAKGGAQARGRATAPANPIIPPRIVEGARRFARWALGAGLIVAAGAGLGAAGVPQMLGTMAGEGIGAAGFTVKRVEIAGVRQMDKARVYAALEREPLAMPLVSLEAIRGRLLAEGWVKEARVSRRLPDTLLIDVVERTPAAIWQHRGRLMLIDAGGVPLAPVQVSRMPDLPILIGPDANRHVAALAALTATAPSLKPMLAGATWIGGRRWDLMFQSGETLALPEGDAPARAALARFARLDKADGLLGEGFVRFDMRVAGKLYARVQRDPGGMIEAPPPPPATVPGATAPADVI